MKRIALLAMLLATLGQPLVAASQALAQGPPAWAGTCTTCLLDGLAPAGQPLVGANGQTPGVPMLNGQGFGPGDGTQPMPLNGAGFGSPWVNK